MGGKEVANLSYEKYARKNISLEIIYKQYDKTNNNNKAQNLKK